MVDWITLSLAVGAVASTGAALWELFPDFPFAALAQTGLDYVTLTLLAISMLLLLFLFLPRLPFFFSTFYRF